MSIAIRGLGVAAAASLLALGLSSTAWADDFISECQKGSGAADPVKACTCMSGKVTGAVRDDAIAAMRTMNAPVAQGAARPDPKTFPAGQQKGLEAVIAAHGQCP
jgi:hypothetical protein